MKRPLAYITAAWCGEHKADSEQAARYCRAVYEAGYSPICPALYLPLFLNGAIPEEHKSGIDIAAVFLVIVLLQSCMAAVMSIGNGVVGAAGGTSYVSSDSDILL